MNKDDGTPVSVTGRRRKAVRLWNEMSEEERETAMILLEIRPAATREHVVRALSKLLRKPVSELPEILRAQSQAFLDQWVDLTEDRRAVVLDYMQLQTNEQKNNKG